MLPTRTGCALAVLLVHLSLLCGFSAATPPAAHNKLDTRLRMFLDRHAASPGERVPLVAHGRDGADNVSVIADGDAATLRPAIEAAGGQVQSVISGRFITAVIPANRVEELSSRTDLRRLEAGRPVRRFNDLGNLAGPGNGSRSTLVLAPPYTQAQGDGEGVVVAIVDSGLDITHPDFIEPNGQSRVLAYWDQSDTTDTNAPAGFGYGRQYSASEIQAAVSGAGALAASALDLDGHGSHVMGTIAGNGRAGTAGYGSAPYSAYQFTGVAPKAKLIAVKFDFEGSRNTDAAIIDAVNYCFQRAAGTPCSVNLSLGSDLGPHDGSTLEERSLDALVGAGKLVFAAAGNAAEIVRPAGAPPSSLAVPIHGSGSFATGSSSRITFNLAFNSQGRFKGKNNDYLLWDIWYPGANACDVKVTGPSGTIYSNTKWRTGAGGAGLATREGGIFVYNGGDQLGWSTNSGDNELYVEISDPAGAGDVGVGNWTITLTGLSGTTTYHAWHLLSDNLRGVAPLYDGQATDNVMTVGSPATARNLIAVGAYAPRGNGGGTANENGWFDASGTFRSYNPTTFPVTLQDLAFFSSRGPSRDGRRLPHVCAAGVGTISVHSKDATSWNPNYLLAGSKYAVAQGTSMSTPNVTGAGALALARQGSLDPDGMRQAMQASARVDAFVLASGFRSDLSGGAPNNDWGAGKLDVPGLLGPLPPLSGRPVVTISSPFAGTSFPSGALVSFAGTATDTEDGDLTGGLSWLSDRDGVIGTGASFSRTLSSGAHLITARVPDASGHVGEASVSITVASPAPTVVRVSAVSTIFSGGKGNNRNLVTTVTLQNNLGSPVSGATVAIQLTRDGAPVTTASGTTGSTGSWSYTLSNAPAGCYVTNVTQVTAAGLVWDGLTPANSACKLP